MSAPPAIELRSVTKTYDGRRGQVAAVNNMTIAVEDGDAVAIMGPSGSGKSTVLHLVAGLLQPTSGEVLVRQRSLATMSQKDLASLRRHDVGLIFQTFNLVPVLNVEENVRLPARLAGLSTAEAIDRARIALEEVGITDLRSERVADLSGGEQQRVAIARAIVLEPPILLADEPTGSLDSDTGQTIMKVLADLNKAGHTIVLVTHDVRVARLANRILSIRDGAVDHETELTTNEVPSLDVLGRLIS